MSTKHIIIIETRKDNRKEVSSLLKKRGFRVSSLPFSNKSLPALVEKKNPDLLLADLTAANRESLEIITSIQKLTGIPLVAITGELTEKSYNQIMDTGARNIVSETAQKWEILSAVHITLQNDTLTKDREQTEDALRLSEARFSGPFQSASHGMVMSDGKGKFTAVNQAFCSMVEYTEEELLSLNFKDITHPDDIEEDLQLVKQLSSGEIDSFKLEKRYICKFGTVIWVLISVSPVRDTSGAPLQFIGNILNISDHKKALETFRTALRFHKESTTINTEGIINESLEAGVRITESQIGFFHLVEPDQQTISLQTWTKNTLKYCTALDKGTHYPVSDAGVWADCIRERKPVVHNDYPHLTHKKGLPEGHVPVSREMALPIFQDNKIVAAMGVGNKSRDYTELDLELLSLIAESMWSVVQHKNYEEALKDSQERYRSMFINNHAIMLILDPETGSIINANPAACEFYGYSREELTEKNISEINTLTLKETKAEMDKARSEKRNHFIFKHLLRNGELRDVEVYSGPIILSGKQHLYSIIHDITIRKKIEDALRYSEEQHRTLFETMTQGAVYFDADGTIISANPAAAKILHIDIEQMKGKKPSDYPHRVITQDAHVLTNENFPLDMVQKTGKSLKDFLIGIQPQGEDQYRWILVNAIPQYRKNETTPYQTYATYTDITELRQAQEEINLFFNVTLDMLCIASFDGYFTKLSPSWSINLGLTNEELMSRPFIEFIHPEDLDKTIEETINLKDGRDVIDFENRYRCKDGSYRWLSWKSFAVVERQIIIAAAHDITQRKENEKALKKSEQRLKEAQHAAHLGYWEIDYGTNSFFWSDEVFRIFGVNPENFTASYESFLKAIHPDDREYVDQRYQESFQVKDDYQVNHRIIRPDGEIRHVFEKCENYFDADEKIERSLGIILDITDRVKAEEKLLLAMQEGDVAREEAIRANQIKSEFLANMSHEIRTPLNAVIGFSELLTSLVFDQQQKNYLASIKTAGKSLLTLINDILDLSKIEAGMMAITRDLVNPHELFKELEQIFSSELAEKKLEFIIDIDPKLPAALILDETRLRQVLLNITGNAVKFTDTGHIKLTAQKKFLQKNHSSLDLIITIEDTGIGIPDEEFDSIFESFRQQTGQSTRRYGGTGLGLSISKKLLELMNGEVTLSSRVGTGSTFIIKLNNVDIASITGKKEVHASPHYENILFQGSRILIVDDVESNRRFLSDLLAQKNLFALEAENGEEALIMMKEECFDAVLMDIRMPVMDGFEAIKKIRSDETLNTNIIIALTASAQQEDRSTILEAGFDAHLTKPVSISILFNELARFIPFENSGTCEATVPKASDHKPDRLPADLAPELREILKTEIIVSMKKLSGAIKPGEIKKLAARFTELSSVYDVDELMHYSSLLTSLAENYDITGIQKTVKYLIAITEETLKGS